MDEEKRSEEQGPVEPEEEALPDLSDPTCERKVMWYCKWRYWDRIIKAVGTVGLVAALFFTAWQVDQMREQNRAIWYSMKPSLYIRAINNESVGKITSAKFDFPEEVLLNLHELWFPLDNVGKSPAIIDTMSIAFIYHGWYCEHTVAPGSVMFPEEAGAMEMGMVPLDELSKTWLCIRYDYSWGTQAIGEEQFTYFKYWSVTFRDGGWSFRSASPQAFSEIASAIRPSKRYFTFGFVSGW